MQKGTAPHDQYEYVALPATGWTRVLELHSGCGTLACSLRCGKIEDIALRYEALSYLWGCDELPNPHTIQCSDRVIYIRSNLHSAHLTCDHLATPFCFYGASSGSAGTLPERNP